jgi:hypothetical protein
MAAGALLGGASTSAYAITVGGLACPVTAVNLTAGNATYPDVEVVNCTLPSVPAGTYALAVVVPPFGAARPILGTANPASMTLSFNS